MKETDLYGPMKNWLSRYLEDYYNNYDIITVDSHNDYLDCVLTNYGINDPITIGIRIKIDVLGIARNKYNHLLFFIEAKTTDLTLRDLGQLWAYCKLIDPKEAFIFTTSSLGSLNKILNVYNREDLLDFGDGRNIKKMRVAVWNIKTNSPDFNSIIPKL